MNSHLSIYRKLYNDHFVCLMTLVCSIFSPEPSYPPSTLSPFQLFPHFIVWFINHKQMLSSVIKMLMYRTVYLKIAYSTYLFFHILIVFYLNYVKIVYSGFKEIPALLKLFGKMILQRLNLLHVSCFFTDLVGYFRKVVSIDSLCRSSELFFKC